MNHHLVRKLLPLVFSSYSLRSAKSFLLPKGASHVSFSISTHRIFSTKFTEEDENYLNIAIQHAQNGLGNTFPNPAVGCVIVKGDEIIGAGFHPKAGMPHAEVFALLEAAGHLENGVEAAQSVINGDNKHLLQKVSDLTELYLTPDGPDHLFNGLISNNAANNDTTTAYVTLEPCCHHGKTPPCAASLTKAKIDRVVVGLRDPNPRVDGGGYRILADAGITVVEASGASKKGCADLVNNFVKRITPRSDTEHTSLNGSKRRALRALAGRQKANQSLAEVQWSSKSGNHAKKKVNDGEDDELEDAISKLNLDPSWMETTDNLLWHHELILLRLNKAVNKKKGAKLLGERIANELNAHVAQVVGHTALIYRPSIPPKLNLLHL